MALNLFASLGISNFTKMPIKTHFSLKSSSDSYVYKPAKSIAVHNSISSEPIVRRSANYQPPTWDFKFMQSLDSPFLGETHKERIREVKEDVRMVLNKQVMTNPLDQLELIDILQRLGLGYHFQDEIKTILMRFFNHNYNHDDQRMKEDLHATALQFRLLRQHGLHAPQEIFNKFKDKQGNFKASLVDNLEGMLSLYEASFLCEEGESILEDARNFSTKHLNDYVRQSKDEDYVSMLIRHALELPLHWRVPRFESRWFIDVYERKPDMNPLLLELAKLDFNYVQAVHQQDLKHTSRWWENTGLGEKLSFARNRLMQNFIWTVGNQFEAEYGYGRIMCTKVNSLITIIDDIYDVYGTLDELELFTAAIERWDVNTIEQLPCYMKITFLTLYNSINKMGLDVIQEKEFNAIPYFKKSWTDLCKYYLMEAKWYSTGYMPTLEEYLDSAWISISAPLVLIHYYFYVTNPITNDGLECFYKYPDIIRYSSMILRLANDLETSPYEMKRGDIPKSVQCYMNESGASEEEAREHIKSLIRKAWMKINKDRVANYSLSETFISIAINLARTAQFIYQHGDGHSVEDSGTVDRIQSLLVHPIPL